MGLGKSMQKNKGFTLVELMVTIAVLAILTTIAAPSFGNMIKNQKFKSNTNALIDKIKQARTYAVLNHQGVTLKLNVSGTDNPPVFNWISEGSARLKNASDTEVEFDKQGFLRSTFDVIEVCKNTGNSESIKITLTALGQIHKVEKGSCT